MRKGALLLHVAPTLLFSVLVFFPLYLGFTRLITVAELSPFAAIWQIDSRPSGTGAIAFTFIEASISTIITILLGIPIAWTLARDNWPGRIYLRAIFTMPFVMPSIIAAVGFLALIGTDGPLYPLGIDLRQQNGIIGEISDATGWENPGHFIALIAAHIWFNLALTIRFLEPPLSNLNPNIEESIKLLPGGNNIFSRMKNLWLPLLSPNIAAASVMTFIFSFTSFALVRWLTPSSYTLERLMAEHGGAAGIPDYGMGDAQIVLGSATIQLITIMISLILLNWLQKRNSTAVPFALSKGQNRQKPFREMSFTSILKTFYFISILIFVLAPLIAVFRSSFRMRVRTGNVGFTQQWTLEGWSSLSTLSWNQTTITEALFNSLGYAALTLLIAVPLGIIFAHNIHLSDELATNARTRGKRFFWKYWARGNDLLVMFPLAISAVLIGLGVSLGLLNTWPSLSQKWWFPAIGHILIATPFVVRSILPAIRSLNPDYSKAAALLGLGPIERMFKITLPLLSGPIVVASSLALAISLGEFGATWVVLRNGASSTLPVHIDALFSKPGFDPLVTPTAMAGASVLMAITLILYVMVEKYRPDGAGGEF